MGYPTDEDFAEAHGWSGRGSTAKVLTQWDKEKEGFKLSNAIMDDAEIPEGFERLVFFSLALAGEAGEAANKVKKMWRDGITPENKKALAAELADVNVYLHNVANELDIDLEQETSGKFSVVVQRWRHLVEGE